MAEKDAYFGPSSHRDFQASRVSGKMANTCLNCRENLEEGNSFCPVCGQKTSPKRLEIRRVMEDIFFSLIETKGLFQLIIHLICRPGEVAREYIKGKRVRYFPPFTFLFLVVGISSFFLGQTELLSNHLKNEVSIRRFLDEHVNLIILLNVPLLAWFNLLIFKNKGYNYAEYLVMASYVSGMRSVFFTLFLCPFIWFFPSMYGPVLGIYFCLWWAYFAWANSQSLNLSTWGSRLRSLLVTFFVQMVMIVLVSAAIYGIKKFG